MENNVKLLNSLALSLVDCPSGSLQELAKKAGISKATLYRFCRTREQLIERLCAYTIKTLTAAIQTAQLDSAPPLEALKRLTANYLEHRELTVFATYFWKEAALACSTDGNAELTLMDAFFLRGQKAGVFRIDIPAPALSDLWFSIMVGLVDAERRGRVAKASLAATIESAFLNGVCAK